MEVKASLKYLRISPRKVRLITDLVKGMPVQKAQSQLRFFAKKGSLPILKLLNSAIANAKHSFNLAEDDLYIKELMVESGPSAKRWMPRAFGRASKIMKRVSHVKLLLDEKAGSRKIDAREQGEINQRIIEKSNELNESSEKDALKKEGEAPREKKARLAFVAEKKNSKKKFGSIRRIFQRKAI